MLLQPVDGLLAALVVCPRAGWAVFFKTPAASKKRSGPLPSSAAAAVAAAAARVDGHAAIKLAVVRAHSPCLSTAQHDVVCRGHNESACVDVISWLAAICPPPPPLHTHAGSRTTTTAAAAAAAAPFTTCMCCVVSFVLRAGSHAHTLPFGGRFHHPSTCVQVAYYKAVVGPVVGVAPSPERGFEHPVAEAFTVTTQCVPCAWTVAQRGPHLKSTHLTSRLRTSFHPLLPHACPCHHLTPHLTPASRHVCVHHQRTSITSRMRMQ
jgi:hypothetical protein